VPVAVLTYPREQTMPGPWPPAAHTPCADGGPETPASPTWLRPSAHFLAVHPAFAAATGRSSGFSHMPPIMPPGLAPASEELRPALQSPPKAPAPPVPMHSGGGGGEPGDGEYYVEEEVVVMTDLWADHFRAKYGVPSGGRAKRKGGKHKQGQKRNQRKSKRQPQKQASTGPRRDDRDVAASSVLTVGSPTPLWELYAGGQIRSPDVKLETTELAKKEDALAQLCSKREAEGPWPVFPESPASAAVVASSGL